MPYRADGPIAPWQTGDDPLQCLQDPFLQISGEDVQASYNEVSQYLGCAPLIHLVFGGAFDILVMDPAWACITNCASKIEKSRQIVRFRMHSIRWVNNLPATVIIFAPRNPAAWLLWDSALRSGPDLECLTQKVNPVLRDGFWVSVSNTQMEQLNVDDVVLAN